MIGCRGCGAPRTDRVLDLGSIPAADNFPPADSAVGVTDRAYPLAMQLCPACGLAQLAADETIADEPRGIEPQALRDQAVAAVTAVGRAGRLSGTTVREFGSPHGGTWLPLLTDLGYRPTGGVADVVVDCFGSMHDADQRAAFVARAAGTAPDGLLLMQYHSLATIVREGQWNSLRHGHFAYYSSTALIRLLGAVGMSARTAWEFDLYGGTVLIAAQHGQHPPDAQLRRLLAAERAFGITDPAVGGRLQQATDRHVDWLRTWLRAGAAAGRRSYAYGAASRAVAPLALAGADRTQLIAVADASPAKHGRRMPGTDIPIISPDELLAAAPDRVLLTLPDLFPEVAQRFPELRGRWQVDPGPAGAGHLARTAAPG